MNVIHKAKLIKLNRPGLFVFYRNFSFLAASYTVIPYASSFTQAVIICTSIVVDRAICFYAYQHNNRTINGV